MMFEHDNPILELTDDQSWKLLKNTSHGRIVLTAAGETDIFPINYMVHDAVLLMRSAPGTKLAEITINENVVFETDGITSEEAWSVVVKGTARVLQSGEEIAEAESLGLKTWIPTMKDFYIEVKPERISGRHFILGDQPERF
ncbi:pyridoxamine 5'-phosphate oxidase family protein [Arthrobacter crystallopoietes]|uniref:Pyridoxamine 5'-phosphate oxidase n=1 Tax=Crystallibacter crystallopoietes TaxID=37928 RepID=A0A1H1CQX4_9MICC|nr:pyridoxamine 5'-phosphate oxidase family protein [Arthrobacter crystallopoietes]AUI50634.1 flavin-nucleotide-binding protein [Arthrobacter crystallopoietes]QTG81791.1 pyridoxamine 5'-phosphate oxidase family protein [Arthrobacter crystallopoietes]SDQ66727.1 Pyridoxamine 5'-phosphate oxidase [Arthrobacter crystallopoietes]